MVSWAGFSGSGSGWWWRKARGWRRSSSSPTDSHIKSENSSRLTLGYWFLLLISTLFATFPLFYVFKDSGERKIFFLDFFRDTKNHFSLRRATSILIFSETGEIASPLGETFVGDGPLELCVSPFWNTPLRSSTRLISVRLYFSAAMSNKYYQKGSRKKTE